MRFYFFSVLFTLFGYQLFAQSTYFSSPQLIATSDIEEPLNLHSTDIDNDGDIDILFSSLGSNLFGWYENINNGQFSGKKIIKNNNSGARDITAADIDGDGLQDILTASSSSIDLIWFKNLGNGVFGNEQIIHQSSLSFFNQIYALDIDLDGHLDAVAHAVNSSGIYWFKNDGVGNFGAAQLIMSNQYLQSISFADLDGDLDLDLVTQKAQGSLGFGYIYLNDGNGVFTYSSGPTAHAVHTADVDGDNDNDIIIINGNNLYIKSNNGTGTFSNTNNLATNLSPYYKIKTVDFDNDNDLDIVCYSYITSAIYLLRNTGTGLNFSAIELISDKYKVRDVALDDFDNDGDSDLALAVYSNDKITWYSNNGSGLMTDENELTNSLSFIREFRLANLTGNTKKDIFFNANNKTAIIPNEIFGIGGDQLTLSLNSTKADIGNLNNDPYIDVFTSNNVTGSLAYHANSSNNSFTNPSLIGSGIGVETWMVGDLNDDGLDDLITQSSNQLYSYLNTGGNTYGSAQLVTSTPGSINDWVLSDLNHDGNTDLLICSYNDSLYWYDGLGNGLFGNRNKLPMTRDKPISVFVTDINGDGFNDIATAFYSSNGVTWHQNDGNGVFQEHIVSNNLNTTSAIYCADIDNDQNMDIISCGEISGGGDSLVWFRNQGNGVFGNQLVLGVVEADYIECTDIDGDGDQDIFYSEDYGQIWFLENIIASASVKGRIFNDLNENGSYDYGEPPLSLASVTVNPSASAHFTNLNGTYDLFLQPNNYTLGHSALPNWQLSSNPATYNIAVANNIYLTGLDFGFVPSDTVTDVDLSINSGFTRCNTFVDYDFNVRNTGTTVMDGILWANIDSTVQNTMLTMPPDTIIDMYNFGWEFNGLYPGEIITKKIELQMPSISGGLSLGDLIVVNAELIVNDYNGIDTFSYRYNPQVFCAFDPNDKLVNPDRPGEENYTLFEEQIVYTIRFQNSGTDTAFNVVVRDTLDPNLDWSTFNIIGSSHMEVLTTTMTQNQFIEFDFQNIMLPDSGANYTASQGYISFSIETNNGLAENTVVENTAGIYFDSNPPIITNTAISTLVTFLPCETIDTVSQIESCDSSMVNGNWYFTSQMVMDTFWSNYQCDSIIATPLVISNISFDILPTFIACDSVELNAVWYYTSQSFTDTLVSSQGCDSVVTTNIEINQSTSHIVFDTIDIGEDYTLPNGNIVDATGVYEVLLQNAENCDSILNIDLFVRDNVGLSNNLASDLNWYVYPNPSSEYFEVLMEDLKETYIVEIYSTIGKKVLHTRIDNGNTIINSSNWAPGIYSVVLKDADGKLLGTKKVIIVR